MVGQKLGPYKVIDVIGVGGMSTVYRAQQKSVGRTVAIKVIHNHMAHIPDAKLRFQREARLIARLEHVHILPVYDFDGAHDPPYIVMRYLEGGTLKEIMAQGLLPISEVTYLMRQVCIAVDYANRQGIMHRDLKPSNIMVDLEGNIFVVDFGIARLAATTQVETQITEAGATIGTPDYMSPEQGMGKESTDHHTDIYALGIILFEMFAGQLPYQGANNMQVLTMHINAPIPSLLAIRTDLPPAIEGIVQRAMAKDPNDRYHSAIVLFEALEEACNGSISQKPETLSLAVGTSILRRVEQGKLKAAGSSQTPSEQNKTVTVVYADAADYALVIEESAGTEAVAPVMEKLWETLEDLIVKNGGIISSRTDNDLVGVWGTEITRESDAEQAIKTALQMQTTMQKIGNKYLFDDEDPLPLNIGINSGLVLLKPSADNSTLSIVGSTINIANRLMHNAFGTILIAHSTFRQVVGVFDILKDVPLRMRGRKEPLTTYRVTSTKARKFKLELHTIEGVETQMVGREAELTHCQQAYLDAYEEDETQIVTLIAKGGLGKSRLLLELNKWLELRPEDIWNFEGRATENMRERPYSLIRDIISMRFQILDSDSLTTILDKLESGVNELLDTPDPEMAHFIGHLCGFDLSHSFHIRGIVDDPQQIAQLGRQKFIQCITKTAQNGAPVMMLLEDMHYADDASLDLLTELFTRNEELPLFVVCVARPALLERRKGWGRGHDIYSQIILKPLSKRDSRHLVRELLQKIPTVPRSLRDLLVDRAEGNPFYMEELVKMLLDDRIILRESDEVWMVATDRLAALQVPTSLYGLLEARLDTLLALEKLTLQRAAVLGPVFFDSALIAIDKIDSYQVPQLQAVLETLEKREFIYRRETSAFVESVEYIFASNMLRDALVNTLLTRQVQSYNHVIAEWLTATAGERRDEYLPQIARYYARAGSYEQASINWLEAGEAALSIGDFKQALNLFRQAYEHLPQNVRLLRQMAETAFILEGFDAAKIYLDAAQDGVKGETEQLQLLLAKTSILIEAGLYDEAAEIVITGLPLARQDKNNHLLIETLTALATANARRDKLKEVQQYLDEALSLARQNQDKQRELEIINTYGLFYAFKGAPEIALDYDQQLLDLAKARGNRDYEATALNNIAEDLKYIDYENNRKQIYSLYENALMIGLELGALPRVALYEANLAEEDIFKEDHESAKIRLCTVLGIGLSANILKTIHNAIESYAILCLAQENTKRGLALYGLMNQQVTWNEDSEHALQSVLKRYQIAPEIVEPAMALGAKLDYDQTLAQIQVELGSDGLP